MGIFLRILLTVINSVIAFCNITSYSLPLNFVEAQEMRTTFLYIILLLTITRVKAQVVFCPPGAEWHSLFFGSIFMPGNTYNEKIQYIGDSISGVDTIKILSHNRDYMSCDNFGRLSRTFLKQKGDTIFFNNIHTPGWQILYNFAAQSGNGWQTTFSIAGFSIAFNFQVQSVSTVTINGLALKQLSVTAPHWGAASTITERLGANTFLFDFSRRSPSSCDGDWFLEPLCYKDNTFGTYMYSSDKSCDYFTQNYMGVEDHSGQTALKIYPNPAQDRISIELKNYSESAVIVITNALGQPVMRKKIGKNDNWVNIESQVKGIYLIQLFEGEKLLGSQKLVKN